MKLIITDVTEMHEGNFCVAGWEAKLQRNIRPLPNGANWTEELLRQHGIVPGATINVVPSGKQHRSEYPHKTEDTVIVEEKIRLVSPGPIDWSAGTAPTTHETVSEAFDGRVADNAIFQDVRQGVHVQVGAQVPSLGAICVPRDAVQFREDFDKLKVVLNDGTARYKLSVSSHALKAAWRQGGIPAVQQALPTSEEFHVRLGLAREFHKDPGKCYMMVNGIHG